MVTMLELKLKIKKLQTKNTVGAPGWLIQRSEQLLMLGFKFEPHNVYRDHFKKSL